MREKRRFPRTNCFKGAKIMPPGAAAIPCIVRNVSAEGAGLQLRGTADLPKEFDLCFDTGQRVRQCRLMWRTPSEAGIWFARQG